MSYVGMDWWNEVAQGRFSNVVNWTKIGYNPSIADAVEDVWSAGGSVNWPTGATAMEVVSSSAGDEDLGTVLHSGTGDAGGSTTTIVKAGENFLTTTAVGDMIILSKAGTTPEWGYITAVTSDTVLTVGGGFSSGGTGASRDYEVIDVSAKTGAHAVLIAYLNTSWEEKSEIVVLNGDAAVALTGTPYRVNSFRVISTGTAGGAVGNLSLRLGGGATVYDYITAGYTRARNTQYTVPAGKTLYVTQWNAGWATPNEAKVQSLRMWTKATVYPGSNFLTNTFYTFSEVMLANSQIAVMFNIPTKLPAKTDIKVSGQSTNAAGSGPAVSALRGYIIS